MADLVRVKGPTAEYTTTRELAEADGLTILDKPAVYESGSQQGRPLPPKPLTTITQKAAEKAATTPKTKEA